MAARATSSATISFGLVSIPIKVYAATSSKAVRFSMLHEADKSRLKQSYTCRECEEPVPRSETVKGFEYARDQYVVLTEEELKAIEMQSDRTIDIEAFVPLSEVDPVYYEKSNLIGPDKGGNKAYRLLRESMQESQRVAIGRFNTRGRQQLVLLRPTPDGLIMQGLHYADEVRNFEDIDLGDEIELKDNERSLASQLIDQLSLDHFDPELYEDGYRRSVMEAVDRKVAGEEVIVTSASEPKQQIIDIVSALKQSLAEAGDAREPKRKTGKPAKKKAGKPDTAKNPGLKRSKRAAAG